MVDYEAEIRGAVAADKLTVPAEWEGFPGQAFGGFAAAAVLVAAADRSEKPRPLSFAARYFRPIPIGQPVTLQLDLERRGRSAETWAAHVAAGDRKLASFTASFGREGEPILASQAIPPMTPLREPRPIWRELEEIGIEVSPLMRRIGFRGEPDGAAIIGVDGPGWHLRSQWPGTASVDLAIRAAVTLMPIDNSVGPALIAANGLDLNEPWPVALPSLDLTASFHALEVPSAENDEEGPEGWLGSRTAVPVTHAGYGVGNTQVWSGDRLVAEGSSRVVLMPSPFDDVKG